MLKAVVMLMSAAACCFLVALVLPAMAPASGTPVIDSSRTEVMRDAVVRSLPSPALLPDDGPRYPEGIRGPEGVLFQQSVDAYRADDLRASEEGFRKIIDEFPGSPLRTACRAFLAEITARRGTDHDRSLAVEQYRSLIRDDPSSNNAARARWRIADLYAEAGWLVEAKAAYEHAASAGEWDRARALLGLGIVLMRKSQWKDAEASLRSIITSTDDGRLLAPATFALADSLYAEQRTDHALTVYEDGRRQWPTAFRQRPQSMWALAVIKSQRGQWADARALYLAFYNLHPTLLESAVALMRVADRWRQEGQLTSARLLYAAIIERFPETTTAAQAAMRLAELGRDIMVRGRAHPLSTYLEHEFEIAPRVPIDAHEQMETLRGLAKAHPRDEVGSEALFHLGELFQSLGQPHEAVAVFQELSDRRVPASEDPWPVAGGQRLVSLLGPWMTAALRVHDDVAAMSLFYRHGRYAEHLYAGTQALLQIADVHRRSGFAPQAVKLYQSLIHDDASDAVHQQALLGLGLAYIDQADLPAARRVFERYLLQYPGAPGKPEALKQLATTLHRLGDDKSVIRIASQWLRVVKDGHHPDRKVLLTLLAEAHANQGNMRQALQAFTEAEQRGGLPGNARLRYADALAAAGELQPAFNQYQRLFNGSTTEAEWAAVQMVRLSAATRRKDARDIARRSRDASGDDFLARVADVLLHVPRNADPAGG